MLDFGFYNMDCLEGMRQFPDKYFDLAVVDPPYGDCNILTEDASGGVKTRLRFHGGSKRADDPWNRYLRPDTSQAENGQKSTVKK